MSQQTFPSELFLPFLHADDDSPQYIRLFRAFQQAILTGKLGPGVKLPATRPLCQALKLSRNTVKTAYEMLLSEGYIETRHGAGTYVSERLPDQTLQKPDTATNHDPSQIEPRLSAVASRLSSLTNRNPPATGKLLLPAQPCMRSFPWPRWQRHVTASARQMKNAAINSGAGSPLLRAQIAEYLRVVRGVKCEAEQVMICSGSQQAVYLTLRMLLNEGEPILVEDPGYYGIDGAITAVGANKVAVPADRDGFQLQIGLEQAPNAHVAMITPSRNYPMGYTMSLERRLELLHWAKQTGSWLIEDDYDSEFRFDGPPLTSLQGLGGEDCVIYTGTFSRILHPSIRLGYLVLPHALVEPFTNARRYLDGGLSLIPQLALAEFMASGQFTSHVRRMRKLYQQRRNQLNQMVEQRFPDQLRRVESDGGMHSVYLLPERHCDMEICDQAQQHNLGIRALSRFYAGQQQQTGLVIGFAGYTETEMDKGLDALAKTMDAAR